VTGNADVLEHSIVEGVQRLPRPPGAIHAKHSRPEPGRQRQDPRLSTRVFALRGRRAPEVFEVDRAAHRGLPFLGQHQGASYRYGAWHRTSVFRLLTIHLRCARNTTFSQLTATSYEKYLAMEMLPMPRDMPVEAPALSWCAYLNQAPRR
jgi:hypothetical protein